MPELPKAAWKKHKITGEWLVFAPGCGVGDKVIVVAKKTGKAKLLKLTVQASFLNSGGEEIPWPGVFKNYIVLQSHIALGGLGSMPTPPSAIHRVHKPTPVQAPLKPAGPRTQKARGVVTLAAHGWQVPAHNVLDARLAVTESSLIMHGALQHKHTVQLPAFCRPCPTVPQHGFVDSRRVESITDIEIVRAETLHADPDGELLLMPQLNGVWSAILTPAGLSIGPGHDAATAGHGAAVSMLLTDARFPEQLLTDATIAADGMPYCELVEHNGKAMVVQLRSGPVVPRAKNYIPKRLPVCHIVDARPYTDLMDWQRVAATIDASCTVVIAADLLCHQAAHCTDPKNAIAVVTDGRPLTPGMILNPEPLPPPDVQAFWEGLHYGLPAFDGGGDWSHYPGLQLALMALHQKAFLPVTGPGARLSGIAMRTALGMASAACHGEARHRIEHGVSRHWIFSDRYADGEQDIHHLEEVFNRPIWGHTFGGKKWAACTRATVALRTAVRGCLKEPSLDAVHACFEALNVVVNVSHNGGLFLTKFGGTSNFDKAAEANAQWIAEKATPAIWQALSAAVALPCVQKDRKKLRQEAQKPKGIARTYAARGRAVNAMQFRLQIQLVTGGNHEQTYPMTKQITAAWEKCKDNAILPSLAGSGAMYVPCFIRGRTVYLKQKAGWYVSTGLELDKALCPPTKAAKKAAAGGQTEG